MQKASILFFSVGFGIMSACNSETKSENQPSSGAAVAGSADHLDLSKTDSVELYHYSDPADQKAFYRTFIKDSQFIQHIGRYIQYKTVNKAPCANDFKLFFYKNGEVYKTIYAATADTCRYFAYVINGEAFFATLNDSAMVLLQKQLDH